MFCSFSSPLLIFLKETEIANEIFYIKNILRISCDQNREKNGKLRRRPRKQTKNKKEKICSETLRERLK